jgi:hypothetical protein
MAAWSDTGRMRRGTGGLSKRWAPAFLFEPMEGYFVGESDIAFRRTNHQCVGCDGNKSSPFGGSVPRGRSGPWSLAAPPQKSERYSNSLGTCRKGVSPLDAHDTHRSSKEDRTSLSPVSAQTVPRRTDTHCKRRETRSSRTVICINKAGS